MTHDDVTAPRPDAADLISQGRAHLGIELGSTRIKAALIDDAGAVLATGSFAWENTLADDSWTYPMDEVWEGLATCFADLADAVRTHYDVPLTRLASLGISAMMHGYIALDADGELLAPFRTWRNTYTSDAASLLSETFGQNIPLRWSVSHLLHAVLGGEDHVGSIAAITTLSGLVHRRLTGRSVLGVGDASGMFPISSAGGAPDYDRELLGRFTGLDAVADVPWELADLLPEVLVAGQDAGTLTEEGARLLDPSGALEAGALTAPPEGDAGTGMVATQAIAPRTGNVSAGTSAFAMVVLERPLATPREEIDMVTTPSGDPVAMIHTNNCTGDLDQWLGVFAQFAQLLGQDVDTEELYARLFEAGAAGDADAGGVLSFNYLSGEHQTGVDSGRPLLVRTQQASFTLENLMRAQLHGAFGALAVGMEVLLEEEKVGLDVMYAHGGIFRTKGVAQQVLADALRTPVALGASAGEGGAWGMALLAAHTAQLAEGRTGRAASDGAAPGGADGATTEALRRFLADEVFASQEVTTLEPTDEGARGYADWLRGYRAALPVERLAGESID
ncbi:ATPase [Brachybacterium halotolerans subsp. kimchii]|uniref:xylulokinase n=1 Tax=Brachybacterium halotolerans TaxID=2795215 RepID=UPI001E5516D5|nr:FGGY-family carbohydrate kinase [Brachybacterium halotolerans]UEJ81629.1 ATPase [Brachybacterium halotolerans subsp. kimchii]